MDVLKSIVLKDMTHNVSPSQFPNLYHHPPLTRTYSAFCDRNPVCAIADDGTRIHSGFSPGRTDRYPELQI